MDRSGSSDRKSLIRKAPLSFALIAAAVAVALALTTGGVSHVQAQARGAVPARSAPRALDQRCFGAAARDPNRPCANPALKLEVVPTPLRARDRPNSPCTIIEQQGALRVCQFGTPPARASGTVALLGDSHAAHWRAALDVVAKADRWRGLSITLSGCPYSTATRVLPEPLLSRCIQRNRDVPAWFQRHPEIDTVFVSELSGAQWLIPPGQDMFTAEVADYTAAWRQLPATVKHIVVIRDDPKDLPGTQACIQRAIADRQSAGTLCAVPRRQALDSDPAVVAAQRLGSARVQVVDLTRMFCDSQRCFPVIGGALVHKDQHHMTAVFVATLGPYLLHDVNALVAGWK